MVARSSAEAQYRAMAASACEVMWLLALLNVFGVRNNGPITMKCDNVSALTLDKNPVFHDRTKHVEMDVHFIREKVATDILDPVYVHNSNQLANLFTKSLHSTI